MVAPIKETRPKPAVAYCTGQWCHTGSGKFLADIVRWATMPKGPNGKEQS